MPRFITIWEVASLFGVSKDVIELWIKAGKFPHPDRQFIRRRWDYEKVRMRLKHPTGEEN